jgi:hypothetical protein
LFLIRQTLAQPVDEIGNLRPGLLIAYQFVYLADVGFVHLPCLRPKPHRDDFYCHLARFAPADKDAHFIFVFPAAGQALRYTNVNTVG